MGFIQRLGNRQYLTGPHSPLTGSHLLKCAQIKTERRRGFLPFLREFSHHSILCLLTTLNHTLRDILPDAAFFFIAIVGRRQPFSPKANVIFLQCGHHLPVGFLLKPGNIVVAVHDQCQCRRLYPPDGQHFTKSLLLRFQGVQTGQVYSRQPVRPCPPQSGLPERLGLLPR
ncbi:hypothetical protein XENE109146_19555 [Xenorhabdus nematophila]